MKRFLKYATITTMTMMGLFAPGCSCNRVDYGEESTTYSYYLLSSGETHEFIPKVFLLWEPEITISPRLGTAEIVSEDEDTLSNISYEQNVLFKEPIRVDNYVFQFLTKTLGSSEYVNRDNNTFIIIDPEELTEFVLNDKILNSAGPIQLKPLKIRSYSDEIVDEYKQLSFKDLVTIDAVTFKITSLPEYGTLYMPDGKTQIDINQTLTSEEASALIYDPNPSKTENIFFYYSATMQANTNDNNKTYSDPSPTFFYIPIDTPTVTISDAKAMEGDDLKFDINLSNPSTVDTEITINTQDVNATDGKDYTGVNNMVVTILAGTTGAILTISSEIDDIHEGKEIFKVNGTVTSGNFGNNELNATGTIIDTDTLPTVTISSESEIEGTDLLFDIKLSHPNAEDTIIDINTKSGTATEDVDFTGKNSTEIIPAGNTGITWTVASGDDNDVETDETFTVEGQATSGNTSNTTLSATDTIKDNDVANVPPVTDDITDGPMANDQGPVDIIDFSGSDSDGTVMAFVIKSLPDAAHGTLYMADGFTLITENQELTAAEASGLKFDPVEGNTAATTFTYAAKDDDGAADQTPATFLIQIANPTSLMDLDNDGFSTPDDCDDNDVMTYPGAPEIPDFRDNDCDGQIDEDFPPLP